MDVNRNKRSVQWFTLAKACLNSKEYLKCVKYVTKAMHYKRDVDYNVMRAQTYLVMVSQPSMFALHDLAAQMAHEDSLLAKELFPCDKRVDRLLRDARKVMKTSADDSQPMDSPSADNCLLLAQELTTKIVDEKYGQASPGLLIEYYCQRSVIYEVMDTHESLRLSTSDFAKCLQFCDENISRESVTNKRRSAKGVYQQRVNASVSQISTSSVVSTIDDTTAQDCGTDCDANGTVETSDDEIYCSDEDIE